MHDKKVILNSIRAVTVKYLKKNSFANAMFYIAAGVVNHTRNKNQSKNVIKENESTVQCPMNLNNKYSVSINIPNESEKKLKNLSITLSPEYLRDVNLWLESFNNDFERRRQMALANVNIDRSISVSSTKSLLSTDKMMHRRWYGESIVFIAMAIIFVVTLIVLIVSVFYNPND